LLEIDVSFFTISEGFFLRLFFERAAVTSSERLLGAFQRKPIDRVPVHLYDFCEYTDEWKLNDESYRPVVEYARKYSDSLVMYGPPAKNEKIFMTSSDEFELKKRHRREQDALVTEYDIETPKGLLRFVTKESDNIHTTWRVKHVLETEEDVEKFLSIPYEPVEYDFSGFYKLQKEVGQRGLMFPGIADPLCLVAELFHFSDFTVWAMTRRDTFTRLCDVMWQRIKDYIGAMLDEGLGPVYRLVGPEYATPPYLPPELFKEYVVKYDREIIRMLHEAGHMVQMHCHGKIARVLHLIEECQPDALDPLEPPPDGDIELAELKKRIGHKITLCGNMEMRDFEVGAPEEIDLKVRKIMEDAKGGGGFILMPAATPITQPLPLRIAENLIQFIDSGIKHGAYYRTRILNSVKRSERE